MGTQGGTGRKRGSNKEKSTAEDDALNLIAREAEARLAAKRAARAEAREIRMKELERQQKEIFQVQKKYYGLETKAEDKGDDKFANIEQWMEESERYSRSSRITDESDRYSRSSRIQPEDSERYSRSSRIQPEDNERYSRSSRIQPISDDDERMSVGSRSSVMSDLDGIGVCGGGSSASRSHKKSKKKKKSKHKDRDSNGYDDESSVMSSRSSRLSDESRASRSSKLDLTSSRLIDDTRASRSSRLDLQPASYASSDLYSPNGLSSSRQGLTYNGYQSSLYEDSLYSGSRRVTGSNTRPSEYTSYRGPSSRTSSRASSARTSPVDDSGSVASYRRSTATGSIMTRDLDDVTIPDFSDVEGDYLEKGSRAASVLTAGTLTSLGGTSSRRGSVDTAIDADAETSIREIKDALVAVDEKYRKAMVSNAQLDNEKNNLMYQVDTLKDSLMELEELLSESRRECDDKVKEHEREKQAHNTLQFQYNQLKDTLEQSEEMLNEIRQLKLKQDGFTSEISDLNETVEWKDKKIGALERQKEYTDTIRIERDELRDETVQLKDILKKHGIVLGPDLSINGGVEESDGQTQDSQTSPTEGNSVLEIRLRKLVDEREKMIEQVKKLKAQLEQKTQNGTTVGLSPDGEVLENGTDPNILEIQRDSSRQISELKFKLAKAEQEVTALEQNVTRLEGQVTRYKGASESAEKVEDELKAEKRKLQRELRSALDKVDELESNNSHLSKRLDKMKSTRGTAPTP